MYADEQVDTLLAQLETRFDEMSEQMLYVFSLVYLPTAKCMWKIG